MTKKKSKNGDIRFQIYPQKKSRVGTIIFEHLKGSRAVLAELKNTRTKNIFKTLKHLSEDNNLHSKDIVLIFSNMYYKKSIHSQNIEIDFEKRMPNDGFISSKFSPFKSLLAKRDDPNNKLKGVDILIITQQIKTLKYSNHMQRFYTHFFKTLGANLKFYGNTGCDSRMNLKSCDRLKEYFFTREKNETYSSLKESGALQLIDSHNDTIDNIGADLSALSL